MLVVAGGAAAGPPADRLREFFAAANAVIRDEATADRPHEKLEAIRRLVRDLFAFREAAEQALGSHWAARTASERSEFVALFTEVAEAHFVSAIASRARLDNGARVAVLEETRIGDSATVRTMVAARAGGEIQVDYRMRRTAGRWDVVDVYIDGVSLVENYRVQMRRVVERSSYAGLLAELRARVRGGPRLAAAAPPPARPPRPAAAAAPAPVDAASAPALPARGADRTSGASASSPSQERTTVATAPASQPARGAERSTVPGASASPPATERGSLAAVPAVPPQRGAEPPPAATASAPSLERGSERTTVATAPAPRPQGGAERSSAAGAPASRPEQAAERPTRAAAAASPSQRGAEQRTAVGANASQPEPPRPLDGIVDATAGSAATSRPAEPLASEAAGVTGPAAPPPASIADLPPMTGPIRRPATTAAAAGSAREVGPAPPPRAVAEAGHGPAQVAPPASSALPAPAGTPSPRSAADPRPGADAPGRSGWPRRSVWRSVSETLRELARQPARVVGVAPRPIPGAAATASPAGTLARAAHPAAAAPPGPATPAKPSPSFWVQVGAFRTAEAASRLALRLGDQPITLDVSAAREPLLRVLVGPFRDRARAATAVRALQARGFRPFIAVE